MKSPVTMSFSLDEEIREDIKRWAKAERKSNSEVIRDFWKQRRFEEALDRLQREAAPKLKQLGIKDEADLYNYLESEDTYEDRVRQQRLLRRGKAR